MLPETSRSWCVLYVSYRCELVVASKLNDLGFETCVPTATELRQWSDRVKKINKVIFPNYVFVELDLRDLHKITEVKHVIKVIKFGSQIAVLKDWEVKLIKDLGKISEKVTIHYGDINKGREVEVISGPLKNIRGFVNQNYTKKYVEISIPSLNCFAKVFLNQNDIKWI